MLEGHGHGDEDGEDGEAEHGAAESSDWLCLSLVACSASCEPGRSSSAVAPPLRATLCSCSATNKSYATVACDCCCAVVAAGSISSMQKAQHDVKGERSG